jgi:formylglycine-generating enzyme required for sulfatase activity
MLETALTILEAATTGHDVYKCLNSLIFGDKKQQLLEQLATDMKDIKLHIEQLSDTILYAVNLDGVRAAEQQQYINNLREIRQLLAPIQQASQQPLLASAMIAAPRPLEALKQPRQVLTFISPLEYVVIPVVDNWDGVPVVFQENGEYFVGWQLPAHLSEHLGCEYLPHWQPNQNKLPPEQPSERRIIIQDGQIQIPAPRAAVNKDGESPKPTPRAVDNGKDTKKSAQPSVDKARKTQKHAHRAVNKAEETEFEYEVVTVDANGKITNRRSHTATQYIERVKGVAIEMVKVPGGTFMMGSPETEEGRFSNEGPEHEVTIKAFYMSKYPITQAQWEAVMGNNPSRFKGQNRPVENISWHDAVKFFQRLSKLTGKKYHLPSEAQWEYACRAGTTTPFYFGKTITTDLANYNGNYTYGSGPKGVYRCETTDVGSFPPNAFGLYDMHGNVWEWCADSWHDNYKNAPTDGSAWVEGGEGNRLFRGGSFSDAPKYCLAANRHRVSSAIRYDRVGVRAVVAAWT